MVSTSISILNTKAIYFEHICSEYDIQLVKISENNEFSFYEAKGDSKDLFLVGLGLGIEIGEQIMYDGCMKIKLN